MPQCSKKSVPLWQKPITNFVVPPHHMLPDIFQQARLNAQQHLLVQKIKTFKLQYKSYHPKEVFIGSKRDYLYYRDAGFYHYYAYDPNTGRKVGSLDLDDYDEENESGEHALSDISVEPLYRRQGIGATLINFANITNMSLNGCRLVIFGGQTYNSRYRLTAEGMQLVRACISRGILEYDQFIEASVGSPSGSFASN